MRERNRSLRLQYTFWILCFVCPRKISQKVFDSSSCFLKETVAALARRRKKPLAGLFTLCEREEAAQLTKYFSQTQKY